MKPQHTPTPWKWSDDGTRSHLIQADLEPGDGDDILWHGGAWAMKPENKAFILRAVNSHDELVEALEELLRHEGDREVDGIGLEHDTEPLEKAKRKAREALAKAQGE